MVHRIHIDYKPKLVAVLDELDHAPVTRKLFAIANRQRRRTGQCVQRLALPLLLRPTDKRKVTAQPFLRARDLPCDEWTPINVSTREAFGESAVKWFSAQHAKR